MLYIISIQKKTNTLIWWDTNLNSSYQ